MRYFFRRILRPAMNRISACLITLNEEENLSRALASLGRHRRRNHRRRFRQQRPHRRNRPPARRQILHSHLDQLRRPEKLRRRVRLQRLDPLRWTPTKSSAARSTLRSGIGKSTPAPTAVYEMARRTLYLGAWIDHSGWYPDFQRRLYRRDAAKFSGIIHESLRFDGKPGTPRRRPPPLHRPFLRRTRSQRRTLHHPRRPAHVRRGPAQLARRSSGSPPPGAGSRISSCAAVFSTATAAHSSRKWPRASVRLKYAKLGRLIAARSAETRGRVRETSDRRSGHGMARRTKSSAPDAQRPRNRGHVAELVAAEDSALGRTRCSRANSRSLRLARLLPPPRRAKNSPARSRPRRFDLVHANEAHAVSAAWLAGAHKRVPFVISRRVGFPSAKAARPGALPTPPLASSPIPSGSPTRPPRPASRAKK